MSFVDSTGRKLDVSNKQSAYKDAAIGRYLAARCGRDHHILIWELRMGCELSVRSIARGFGLDPGYVSKLARRVDAAIKKDISEENIPRAAFSNGFEHE
jgi:hypothetical protein